MATKTPSRRYAASKSQAAAKQISIEIMEQLTETVATLVNSDAWPKLLAAMVSKDGTELSRFSFNNLLLILMQCPEASAVVTSKAWAARGRFPQKGSKSLRIYSPISVKDDRDSSRTKIVGFRMQAEFDVSQTEPMWQNPHNMIITPTVGRPSSVKQLQGEAPADMWGDVSRQITNLGYTIETGNTGDAMGVTDPKNKIVHISHTASPAQAAKTLAHELGHILADHVSDLAEYGKHRGVAETVAESFAYMVSAFYGLDSAQYSAPYIGTWAGKDPEVVQKAVQDCGKQVLAMFRGFVTALAPSEETEALAVI